MAAQHHYVSKFHLREFCDPDSLTTPDPWVWLGLIQGGTVKRRSPKNVGTARLMFDGPGGLADRDSSIEIFLANEVEGPAARAIKRMGNSPINELPPELMRYLSWAASRSRPIQLEFIDWGNRFNEILAVPVAESPPDWLQKALSLDRPSRMVHLRTGECATVSGEDAMKLFDDGWFPDPLEQANFLEIAHCQALYFQHRWFPRLNWFTLRPPASEFFIIGDRPVGWGVPNAINAPPSCLRDPDAFVIAPVTRSLALVGRNSSEPWSITPAQVNGLLALWSHEWIAGPTEEIVQIALKARITWLASAGKNSNVSESNVKADE